MNRMKLVLTFSFMLCGAMQMAFADETVSETVSASADDAKRVMRKGAHRAEELFCAASDLECTARKASNRVTEAKDAAVDGAKKLKNKVD